MLTKTILLISASLVFASGVYGQGTPSATTTPSTTDAAKRPPVFRPTKDQIEEVQTILKNKKLYAGSTTGTYNDETRSGIKSFQKANGLKETGTLNRATLEKFGVELTTAQSEIPVSPNSYASPKTDSTGKPAATTSDPPKRPAPFRATSDQIKLAQKTLKDNKMYTGEETGKLDDATRDGLRKYQDANGIKVTGTLNAVTLQKMAIVLTDKQKAASIPTKPSP